MYTRLYAFLLRLSCLQPNPTHISRSSARRRLIHTPSHWLGLGYNTHHQVSAHCQSRHRLSILARYLAQTFPPVPRFNVSSVDPLCCQVAAPSDKILTTPDTARVVHWISLFVDFELPPTHSRHV